MKIDVITRPYEVTDQAGVKTEKLYMSKVTVQDGDNEYETILAYHINTKNYFLLKDGADNDNLAGSFAFTEERDDDIEEAFLEITNQNDITVGKSSTNWLHLKL